MTRRAWLALPLVVASCGDGEPVTRRAPERGRALFSSPTASPNQSNVYSCATCHTTSSTDARRLAGANLAGVVARPSLWGGRERDLLSATNACLRYFMLAPAEMTADEDRARDLYAYLDSLPPEVPGAVAFTVVGDILDLPGGDASRGAASYDALCRACHGQAGTGAGRVVGAARLPDDTRAEHASEGPDGLRRVVIEKVRHGAFLGYSGRMPPFSAEVLPDDELADIAAFLGF